MLSSDPENFTVMTALQTLQSDANLRCQLGHRRMLSNWKVCKAVTMVKLFERRVKLLHRLKCNKVRLLRLRKLSGKLTRSVVEGISSGRRLLQLPHSFGNLRDLHAYSKRRKCVHGNAELT